MLPKAQKFIRKARRQHPLINAGFGITMIVIGALLVGCGLELFIVPNGFLDGGVTGIAIIVAKYAHLPLGLLLAIINAPFLFVAYKQGGIKLAIYATIGIGALVLTTLILHDVEPLTHNFVLALGYGGTLLGVGVGLAVRFGGGLDGAETLSVALSNKINLDVEQILLGINLLIFIVAAFTFTPERAMASFLLFYVIVSPIVKKVVETGVGAKSIQIITNNSDPVIQAIHKKLKRRVVKTHAQRSLPSGDDTVKKVSILTVIVPLVQETDLINLVNSIDPHSVILINDAVSIHDGLIERKS